MTRPDAPVDRPLETIRAELDRIDERIHELVVRRAGLADQVRRAKTDTGAAALRPAREAQMLRRLAAFDGGAMQLVQIWRLWRELIMANARLQFPFIVDTVAAHHDLDLWDMGRAHFCFETDMEAHDDSLAALSRAASGPARVALLRSADATWWPQIASRTAGMRVFTALPMIAENPGSPPSAMVIGDVELAPSGNDVTVVFMSVNAMPGDLPAAVAPKLAYSIVGPTGTLIGWPGFSDEVPPALESALGGTAGATVIGIHAAPVSAGAEARR